MIITTSRMRQPNWLIRLRTKNRLTRILMSRHLADLRIIAVLAVILATTIILFWLQSWRNSAQHTEDLDRVTGNFYDKVACIEAHAGQLGSDAIPALLKARDNLATARAKIPAVDGYLWEHVSAPASQVTQYTTNLSNEMNKFIISTAPFIGDLKDNCYAWRIPTAEEVKPLTLQMSLLSAAASRLASALSSAQSSISVLTVVGAFLTAFFALFAWFYRTGDARLTAIDTIAAEIFSLCRAMSNNQSIRNFSSLYNETPKLVLGYIQLEENYDQFMESVGNSLGFLDQYTIIRVTGFYTSLKIARDRIRMLKNWAVDAASSTPSLASTDQIFYKNTLKQIIYDLFLCLENARISLHLLLEKEDFHDDCLFVVLISEIRAFIFLFYLPDNTPYIQNRLSARVNLPRYGTHEELEAYLHPKYANAFSRFCAHYEEIYEDKVGSELVIQLGEGIPVESGTKMGSNRLNAATAESRDGGA